MKGSVKILVSLPLLKHFGSGHMVQGHVCQKGMTISPSAQGPLSESKGINITAAYLFMVATTCTFEC